MLISYVLLIILFIFGLIGTFFIKLPTNDKFAYWFQHSFSLQKAAGKRYGDDNEKKMKKKVVMKTITAAAATTGSNNNNNPQFKKELKSVFATFDKNNDGFITRQELKESLKNIGIAMSDKDVKEMVERVDANGDGLIDLDEFCDLFESIMTSTGEGANGKEEDGGGYLKEAFDVFDGDGDGVITVEELGMVLSSLGFKEGKLLESCKEMIRKVDVDGDGKINFDEFKLMMKAGTSFLPMNS